MNRHIFQGTRGYPTASCAWVYGCLGATCPTSALLYWRWTDTSTSPKASGIRLSWPKAGRLLGLPWVGWWLWHGALYRSSWWDWVTWTDPTTLGLGTRPCQGEADLSFEVSAYIFQSTWHFDEFQKPIWSLKSIHVTHSESISNIVHGR